MICFSIVFLFVYFILPTFNIDKKTIYSVKCDAKEFKTAIPDAIIPPLNNTQTDYLIYYRSDTKQSLYAKISYKSETEEYDEYILFSNYRDFKNKSIFNDLTEYCVINGFKIKYKQTKKEAFASFSKGLHEYYFRYKTMQERATGDGMSPDGAAQPKSAWESLRDKLDNVLV